MTKAGKDPIQAMADHADGKDTLEFSEDIRHGRMIFRAKSVVRFEDPAAAAYFDIAFNGTEFTTKKPDYIVTDEELNFDPDDPRENETIDPHTIIGVGREGVTPGTKVHVVAGGDPDAGNGEAPLDVHPVHTKSEG